jgi:hypothetical protein
MSRKSTGVAGLVALVIGLAGFAATGCGNLDVTSSISETPQDSTEPITTSIAPSRGVDARVKR